MNEGGDQGGERSNVVVDPQLWNACAGRLVHVPSVNSKVFYFPQGHADHAGINVDRFLDRKVPSQILCRVMAVEYKADSATDEVFVKISLVPVSSGEEDLDESGGDEENVNENDGGGGLEKPSYFLKILTQSDANNGGGFSVPRQCGETIFPPLDYAANPPVQTLFAKDVHGNVWKFRHIYRGTPRRHLLTTGWSTFVNDKKLVSGDSIVFCRANNGDVSVGIKRVKRSCNEGGEIEESRIVNNRRVGKIRPESVIEAANLAADGKLFEVVYYPNANNAEAFCVKASAVNKVMRRRWWYGMRFKKAFESDDSSRVNWFMGTVSSVSEVDPSRWPRSLWRVLEVTWDDGNFLKNVKRINPWFVQLGNTHELLLSSLLPPRKKYRLSQSQQSDITHDGGQLPVSSPLANNTLGVSIPLDYLSNNTPVGIQGARQISLQISSSSTPGVCPGQSFEKSNQILLFGQRIDIEQRNCDSPPSFSQVTDGSGTERSPSTTSTPALLHSTENEGLSSFLTIGNSGQSLEKSNIVGANQFLLFGQCIDIGTERSPSTENGLNSGHCKILIDSKDSGLSNDISGLGSYEDLFKNLSDLIQIERSQIQNCVVYYDESGVAKRPEDVPFSDFMRTAKTINISTGPSESRERLN